MLCEDLLYGDPLRVSATGIFSTGAKAYASNAMAQMLCL